MVPTLWGSQPVFRWEPNDCPLPLPLTEEVVLGSYRILGSNPSFSTH